MSSIVNRPGVGRLTPFSHRLDELSALLLPWRFLPIANAGAFLTVQGVIRHRSKVDHVRSMSADTPIADIADETARRGELAPRENRRQSRGGRQPNLQSDSVRVDIMTQKGALRAARSAVFPRAARAHPS